MGIAEYILVIIFIGFILNIIVKRVVKRLDHRKKIQEEEIFDKLKQRINEQDTKKHEEEVPES